MEDLGHGLDLVRRLILGILFWGLIIGLFIGFILSGPPRVRDKSLLVVHPVGTLVDAYSSPASFRGLPVGGYLSESLLDDLVSAVDAAAADERIIGVWVNLNDLTSAGPAAAGELADALARFRESGKPVLAGADTYDTSRYRIASAANEIVLDRLGEVFVAGYGSWRAYYAEGLEKLGGEAHLFRSGESKSAAENAVLDKMSEASLRDERRLFGDLWNEWLSAVAKNRGMNPEDLEAWIDGYDEYLAAAGGDGSAAALKGGLVDTVETGGVLEGILSERFGDNPRRRIDALDYAARVFRGGAGAPKIAVIPVTGALVYGEGSAGTAGSDDIVGAVTAARELPGVAALVVRIDSPGGDVRAGEAVRRSLAETREKWGLPVVASMGDMAASGGYWIALESDLIVTRPETVTGSIGVYSLTMTFEKALRDWLGVRIDGVGTTPWSGGNHPGRSLDDRYASLYASGIKDIDMLFQGLVAEKRGLDEEAVASLAGGIPWSGGRAVASGLADKFGGLEEARKAAAELAGVEKWKSLYFEGPVDPRAELMGRLLWGYRGARASAKSKVYR